MSRRRRLIAYDIADPRRLRRVISIMESYGTRLQYSVFLCDLSRSELVAWRTEIERVLELREDSVVLIDMGDVKASTPVEVIGVPRRMPPAPGLLI